MKYIIFAEHTGWDHRPYFTYLEAVRQQMPNHLYEFAANPDHHNLSRAESDHVASYPAALK